MEPQKSLFWVSLRVYPPDGKDIYVSSDGFVVVWFLGDNIDKEEGVTQWKKVGLNEK